MANADRISQYQLQARNAEELVRAWSLLRVYASREPALGRALAAVDTTEMTGPIDATAIEVALGEAQTEADRCTALAELERRRAAAGLGPDARCACSHGGSAHARRMADGRLPCHVGCDCQDLVLVGSR
ncbi:hypothetical protein GCM10020000_87060 [Streptomyces olivoverticillatus]